MARTITDGRGTSQRDILTQPMGGGLTQVADADGVLRQVGQQHGWHVDADGVAVRTRENVEAMDDIAQTPVADEISDLMDVGAETEARELAARHGYRISANGRSLLRADAPSEIRWDGVSGTTEEFGDLVEDLADASLGGRVELEPDDLVRLRQEAYDLMEGGANESAQELLGAARYGMDPDGELSWLGPEAAAAGNANSSRLAASVHRLIEEDDLQGAIDLAERNGYELAIQGDHPVLIRREGQVADELDEVPGGAPDRSEAEMRHAQAEDLLSFFERASDSDKAKMLAGIGIGGMAMSDEGGGGGLAVAAGAIVKPGRGRLFRTTGLRGVPDYGVQSRIARETGRTLPENQRIAQEAASRIARETGRTLPENQRIAQEAADAQAESRLPMARENIERAIPEGEEWFNLTPLREGIVDEVGEELGGLRFKGTAARLGPTSSGSTVPEEIARTLFAQHGANAGIPISSLDPSNSAPWKPLGHPRYYGGMLPGLNRIEEAERVGGNVLEALDPVGQFKTRRMSEGASGNYQNIPPDMHMGTQYFDTKKPNAYQRRSIEKIHQDVLGPEYDMEPIQSMAAQWVGGAEQTGIRDPRGLMDIFNDEIGKAAQRMGLSDSEFFSRWARWSTS